MQNQREEVRVAVPAEPAFVKVLRLVVGSVAARLEFPYDLIQDLTLAVDEACAALFALRPKPSEVGLRITPLADGIEISACADCEPGEWPPAGIEETIAWQILSALSDEARFEREGNQACLRLVKRLSPVGDRP